MKRSTYWLRREPIAGMYRHLIDLGAEFCTSVQLVVPESTVSKESSGQLLGALEPFLETKRRQSEWPGTRLVAGTAVVYRFALCADSTNILKAAVDGLYSRRGPNL